MLETALKALSTAARETGNRLSPTMSLSIIWGLGESSLQHHGGMENATGNAAGNVSLTGPTALTVPNAQSSANVTG